MNSIVVKLLTKPGCVLCEKSYFVLGRQRRRFPEASFQVVNIQRKPEYAKFLNELPVVLVNEEVACKFKTSEKSVRELLEKFTKAALDEQQKSGEVS